MSEKYSIFIFQSLENIHVYTQFSEYYLKRVLIPLIDLQHDYLVFTRNFWHYCSSDQQLGTKTDKIPMINHEFSFHIYTFSELCFQIMYGKFHVKVGIVLFAKDAHLLILLYTAFTADPRAHARLLSYRLASNIFRDLSTNWHNS